MKQAKRCVTGGWKQKIFKILSKLSYLMDKKGQFLEGVAVIIILIGGVLGTISVANDISNPRFVGDIATKNAYPTQCTKNISAIPENNRIGFILERSVKDKGFILEGCNI